MTRLSAVSVAVLACGLGASCGGLSYEVDRDLLREVSVENKLLLFEAENDVSIAIDEQELIARQIHETRRQINEVASLKKAAEADEDRADAKNDQKAAQLASRSQDILNLKRDYLEAHVDALREKQWAQSGLVRVALAKYELAKAKLVRKNNVPGAADVELADFEKQVDEVVAKAREEQASVDAVEKEAEAKRKEWVAARAQLEKTSGGGAASPWADDASAWGAP